MISWKWKVIIGVLGSNSKIMISNNQFCWVIINKKGGIKMYIPTIVIICMVCGGIGGALGSYLTKKNKKQKNKEDD